MSVYNTSERGHHMPSPGLHGMRWVRLRQTRLERFQREWGQGTFGTPSISCIPLNNAHKLVAPSDLLTASFPDSAVCCLILRQRGRTRDTRAFISFSFCLTWLCSSPSSNSNLAFFHCLSSWALFLESYPPLPTLDLWHIFASV